MRTDEQYDRQIAIFDELAQERERQDAKFGEQNPPSVPDLDLLDASRCSLVHLPEENTARSLCDQAFFYARGTWAHIAVEELCEAVEAPDEVARRTELVQLAAVVVAWIECIDRRAGK